LGLVTFCWVCRAGDVLSPYSSVFSRHCSRWGVGIIPFASGGGLVPFPRFFTANSRFDLHYAFGKSGALLSVGHPLTLFFELGRVVSGVFFLCQLLGADIQVVVVPVRVALTGLLLLLPVLEAGQWFFISSLCRPIRSHGI